jgi:hypothetical protein
MTNLPNGYQRQPKTEIEKNAEVQAASLLKINRASLPKLASLRAITAADPGLGLEKAAKAAGCSYITAQRWRKKGFLDPDNYNLALSIAQRLGPEFQNIIAENSAGLIIEAQRQVLRKLPEASAKDASGIAVQQQQVAHLATGQATSIVEFSSREELILSLKEAGLLKKPEEVIEGEIVGESAAA